MEQGNYKDATEAAWQGVMWDCGCPDIYFCPAVGEIECPRHSGFDVCCDRPDDHIPVRGNDMQSVIT